MRKGDVILLQGESRKLGRTPLSASDVSFSAATGTQGPRITLSPSGGSVPEPIVLYRTLPRYATNKSDYVYQSDAARVAESPNRGEMSSEDRAFRPHLRLSDPGLRLVAKMAEWCAQWVGGEPPVV